MSLCTIRSSVLCWDCQYGRVSNLVTYDCGRYVTVYPFLSRLPDFSEKKRIKNSNIIKLLYTALFNNFSDGEIDLIELSLITVTDYATDWSFAKPIPKATEDAIANFIFDEMHAEMVIGQYETETEPGIFRPRTT